MCIGIKNPLSFLLSLCLVMFLAGCGSSISGPSGPSKFPPEFTGVKIGKPYEIGGKWYYPKDDPYYDRQGVASWYGPGFHGRRTANGEIYNQYDLTAAHPTLPMPSIVEVTNLENGRQIQLRVNDRGPFHDDRIIDLSKASAEKLGVKGLAKVRVRMLREETQAYIDSKGKTTVPSTRATRLARAIEPSSSGREKPQEAIIGQREGYVPLRIANNRRAVVESAPVTSVKTSHLPSIISSAHAAEPPRYLGIDLRDSHDAAVAKVRAEEAAQEDTVAPLRYQPFERQPQIEKQAPVAEETAVKQPPPAAPVQQATAPATAGWMIKVAAFSQMANAQQMIHKLRAYGQPEIETARVNGRQWYRVLLRPHNHHSPAELLATVRSLGAPDAHVM